MELVNEFLLSRALYAFLVSVIPHVLYHLLRVLEVKQATENIAREGSRPTDSTTAVNQNVSLVFNHMINDLLDNLLVPYIEVFRRCHLDDRVLEQFNPLL